jgi:hypothetical protein
MEENSSAVRCFSYYILDDSIQVAAISQLAVIRMI